MSLRRFALLLVVVLAVGVAMWWPTPETAIAPEPVLSAPEPERPTEPAPVTQVASEDAKRPATASKRLSSGDTLSTVEMAEVQRMATTLQSRVQAYHARERAWPNSNDVLDLLMPTDYQNALVQRAEVVDDGEVIITLHKGAMHVGEIHWRPHAAGDGNVQWQCESFDFNNVSELATPCEYRGQL